jgi:hypothetical protein
MPSAETQGSSALDWQSSVSGDGRTSMATCCVKRWSDPGSADTADAEEADSSDELVGVDGFAEDGAVGVAGDIEAGVAEDVVADVAEDVGVDVVDEVGEDVAEDAGLGVDDDVGVGAVDEDVLDDVGVVASLEGSVVEDVEGEVKSGGRPALLGVGVGVAVGLDGLEEVDVAIDCGVLEAVASVASMVLVT